MLIADESRMPHLTQIRRCTGTTKDALQGTVRAFAANSPKRGRVIPKDASEVNFAEQRDIKITHVVIYVTDPELTDDSEIIDHHGNRLHVRGVKTPSMSWYWKVSCELIKQTEGTTTTATEEL